MTFPVSIGIKKSSGEPRWHDRDDYLVAVDPLKDAIASSVLPNISKTVKNFVISSTSFV
jgi:hypothetical protein